MKPQNDVNVYLVEDSPIMRRVLMELIETTGATVVGHADTASTAITDIAALHPDAVTIDISLKKGTGFDVLEAIAINDEGHPPVRIVLTNHTSDVYREAAQELGAEHFFDKAVQMRSVVRVLESLTAEQSNRRRAA